MLAGVRADFDPDVRQGPLWGGRGEGEGGLRAARDGGDQGEQQREQEGTHSVTHSALL